LLLAGGVVGVGCGAGVVEGVDPEGEPPPPHDAMTKAANAARTTTERLFLLTDIHDPSLGHALILASRGPARADGARLGLSRPSPLEPDRASEREAA
jgi:hypothetical protein